MISDVEAREFAKLNFPEAPEKLAKHLGVIVRESPMGGCDGWCLTTGPKTIIRINSKLSATRRRFTLAHELGHLILGVPTVVGESFEDMLRSDSDEERQSQRSRIRVADSDGRREGFLAGTSRRGRRAQETGEESQRIRTGGGHSRLQFGTAIGLVNASVVLFDGEQIRWQWSRTLSMPRLTAVDLLAKARNAAPNAFRHPREKGDVIVASTIENPFFGSATLFVQLLPVEVGMTLSRHERRMELEAQLFQNNTILRQQISGCMGIHKSRRENKTLAESESDFWKRYRERLKNTPLDSKAGREYVKLRLSEWF